MESKSIYINVSEVNSEKFLCIELTEEVLNKLKNSTVVETHSKFPIEFVNETFIQNYKEYNDVTILSLYYLINLHIQNMDKELRKVADQQKHNTFAIIIDGKDVNVFASSPQENKNDAEKWGAFLIHTYNETCKAV